ncbi:MAG: 4Fe-4S binding protein [Anaerolineaceae bacterium]|nr:4Fe-4S binding protein [Anaerolineaceae bacterium]
MRSGIQYKKLLVPIIIFLTFTGLGIGGYLSSGYIQFLIMFSYIGLSLGVGLGLYTVLPKQKKPIGRRLTLFLVGLFLIGFAIFMGQENAQIEGAIFGLLTGVFQMAVIHYLIAKIFGPLLFGRMWCGWACWTVLVLDLLPFTRSSGRQPPKELGKIRNVHFGLSLILVIIMVYVVGFRDGAAGPTAVIWFIAGNLLYYLTGIILAYALKDNRAFCKYACPVCIPLKLTSRFSLLKIGGEKGLCTACGACARSCPMDIDIPAYINEGKRVLSTECILCQTCITVCPQDALNLSFGFDLGGQEYLTCRTK